MPLSELLPQDAKPAAEVVRESVVAADTRVRAQIAPAQVRYRTEIRLDVLQSRLGLARIELPASQSVLQVKGDEDIPF